MIRQANVTELTKHLKELIKTKRTLTHISGFKQWLVNLYSLGYLQRECAYEKRAAEQNTPASKEVLQRMVDGNLRDYGFTMSMEFCLSCRRKSSESLLKEGLCEECFRLSRECSKVSREGSRISRNGSRISQDTGNRNLDRSYSKTSQSRSYGQKTGSKSESKTNNSNSSSKRSNSNTSTFSFVENHQNEKYQANVRSATPSKTDLSESSLHLDMRQR